MALKIDVPEVFMHLASAAIQKYFSEYKGIRDWIETTKKEAHENELVKSPFGRIKYLPDINSAHNNKVAEAERQAVNMPIQSGASDIGQRRLAAYTAWLMKHREQIKSAGVVLVNTVHDSFVAEVNKDHALALAKHMKAFFEDMSDVDFMKCSMRMDIEIGPSYGELTEVDLDKNETIQEILDRAVKKD